VVIRLHLLDPARSRWPEAETLVIDRSTPTTPNPETFIQKLAR
jgi:hypothetical protein